MTKHRKRREMKPFPKMEEAQPFDPDEFNTALNWYQNAYMHQAHVSNPENYKVNIDYGNGKVDQIGFTDIPMNRGMIALKERYGHDTLKFFSITMRIWAMFHIMHDPNMKKYIRHGEEYDEFHPAVLDAAALVMLDKDGNFPVDVFFSKVEELIETKYKGDETIT